MTIKPPPLVVVDTTTLFNDAAMAGSAWIQALALTARGLIRLAVPTVVVMEAARTHLDLLMEQERKAKDFDQQLRRLADLGIRQPLQDPMPEWSPPTRAELVSALTAKIVAWGGEVLALPEISHADLVNRDLDGQLPFQPSGKGYRDALIWSSVVARAKRATAGQRLYFVTANSRDYVVGGGLAPELSAELPPPLTEVGVVVVPSMNRLLEEPDIRELRDRIVDSRRSSGAAAPASIGLIWHPSRTVDGVDLNPQEDAALELMNFLRFLGGSELATNGQQPASAALDFTAIDFPPGMTDIRVDHFVPYPQSVTWEVYETGEDDLAIEACILTDGLYVGWMRREDFLASNDPQVMDADDDGDPLVEIYYGESVVLVLRAHASRRTGVVDSIEFDHALPVTDDTDRPSEADEWPNFDARRGRWRVTLSPRDAGPSGP